MKSPNNICLAMLVRDESTIIARCLRSLKTTISHYFIIDTGSLDDTAELISQELADLEGQLVKRPFSSFGCLREELYQQAGKLADYVLVVDADETLQAMNDHPFETELPDIGLVEIDLQSHSRRQPRLLRSGLNISCSGYLFESLDYSSDYHVEVLANLRLSKHQDGYRSRQERQAQSDIVHLLAELDGSPRTAEILLRLAETSRRSGQIDQARYYCQRCIELDPDPQILWQAYYQYGQLSKQAGADPDYVMQAFMQAYELFPDRAEPLLGIIDCLRQQGKDEAAASLSKVAAEIALPADAEYFEPACYANRAPGGELSRDLES